MIYCALGSLAYLSKKAKINFFQTVIDAARKDSSLSWIIALGNEMNTGQFDKVPDNVFLVNYAPQLTILRRASVMITHGGTNTIKECILFGVPMIVFPLGFDHPGNAARVVHHGLGVCGNIKKLTSADLLKMLNKIIINSYYREQVSFMQKKFKLAEAENRGIELINKILVI